MRRISSTVAIRRIHSVPSREINERFVGVFSIQGARVWSSEVYWIDECFRNVGSGVNEPK